jgi:hypothetical protein
VSFDNVQLVELNDTDNSIEKPAIDQETAFNNAWILIIKPLLENMCLEQAKKVDEYKLCLDRCEKKGKLDRQVSFLIQHLNANY